MHNKANIRTIKDKQSRKYCATFNNPLLMNPPMTHEQIKEEISKLTSVSYWCMADEVGLEEQTPHTHVYIHSLSPIRFSTIKRRFPQAHLESAYSTASDNRDYILKEGKWKSTAKSESSLPNTFEEFGELPSNENRSEKGELQFIYDMIESGYSTAEILRLSPPAIKYLDKIDRTRQLLIEDTYKDTWRDLTVTYVFGASQTNKTRSVMDKYGYSNVFRVTDYTHPFDGYKPHHEVIMFEEFDSSLKITLMNNLMDGYPCELVARYNNKTACYLQVFIISNLSLEQQYPDIQREKPDIWKAFLRRIHSVVHHSDNGSITTYNSVKEYFERNTQLQIPFGNEKDG